MPVAGWALDDAQPAVELADLRLFVVLAEELHFGRAAARLHLSQPGLSYRFKALEQALGYQVLARNRRGVRLTPAGEAVLGGARRLLGKHTGWSTTAAGWRAASWRRCGPASPASRCLRSIRWPAGTPSPWLIWPGRRSSCSPASWNRRRIAALY